MSDSLEKNPFYRALVTQFQDQFTLASKECSMICIPRSSSMKGVSLNKHFISSHLLKQSPLLKSHLVPLDNSQVTDVEARRGKLFVSNKKCPGKIHEIDIISSEDAFNNSNKMYQMNVIDRPMTYPFIENIHQCDIDDIEASVTSLNDCKLYLMQISTQKFRQLLNAAQKFCISMSITPHNLDEVSTECASFIENQVTLFNADDMSTDEDIVKYSVESVVVSLLCESFMDSIRTKFYELSIKLSRQMDLIKEKKLNLSTFGSQLVLKIDSSKFRAENPLSRLNSTYTPIEKVTIFKEFISSVRNQVENLVQESRSPFDISPPVPVLSEDLIAATILVLSDIKNNDLLYHLKFVQLFGSQLPSMDEMAFSVVTIEAAMQIIEHVDTFSMQTKTKSRENSGGNSQVLHNAPQTPTDNFGEIKTKKADPVFDRKLRKLNKLLTDVTTEDNTNSTSPTTRVRSPSDEDLGEFLSSLHVSKFQ